MLFRSESPLCWMRLWCLWRLSLIPCWQFLWLTVRRNALLLREVWWKGCIAFLPALRLLLLDISLVKRIRLPIELLASVSMVKSLSCLMDVGPLWLMDVVYDDWHVSNVVG
ncbi:unnamed protein product [Prunus brigantina]